MLGLFQRRPAVLLAILIVGSSFACAATSAQADETQIAVIASNHDSLPAISDNMLREIYLKKIVINSDGRPYIPVNLPPVHRLRDAFIFAVLHMSLILYTSSEPTRLGMISYAVFCLKKKKK